MFIIARFLEFSLICIIFKLKYVQMKDKKHEENLQHLSVQVESFDNQ